MRIVYDLVYIIIHYDSYNPWWFVLDNKKKVFNHRKEKSMTDKVQKIRKEVEILQNELIQEKKKGFGSDADDACILELQNVLTYIDSLQEEHVSEDLEEACEQLAENARKHKAETSSPFFSQTDYRQGVIDGAKWQKAKDQKKQNYE